MARTQARFGGVLAVAAATTLLVQMLGSAFVSSSARPGRALRSAVVMQAEGATGGDRLKLKVLSPEGSGVEETVSEVILPSASGQLGVLANHAPMMTALDTGVLRFKKDGQWKPLVVVGGFASVDANVLSILVNDFETVDKINLDEAKTQLETATDALGKAESKKDKLDATAKVKKAAARVQAAMFSSKK